MTSPHPTPLELSRHLGGLLAAGDEARVTSHLAGCPLCRGELAALRSMRLNQTAHEPGLADTHVPAAASAQGLDEVITGFEVGRYVVTRRLGHGAMGQVFAAFDPRLDRPVAVKLLRPDVPEVESRALRARLEREAQALARLNHPNVVAVHDLGEYGEGLFITMDLIEGSTLTQWLATPRAWPEVQRLFLMAGRGLAAAHRAGLVHRDFKPDNVLVDLEGVARVSDFGVSRRVEKEPRGDEDTITGAGSLIGTPAYMSPEQYDGKPADPRSDQFSFCVALFEALTGRRPYEGRTLRELSAQVHAGPPSPWPPGREVPAWLQTLVLRGLAPRPDARFPSMEELLRELEGPPPALPPVTRRSRTPWVVAAVALLLAASALVAEWRRRRSDPCFHVEDRAGGAWNEAQREAARAALLATGVPWAPDTWQRVESTFRRFLGRWETEYHAACREPSGLRSTRLACLDRELLDFEHRRDLLGTVAPGLIRGRLDDFLSGLSAACGAGGVWLEVPTEPQQRAVFNALYEDLEQLRTEVRLDVAENPGPRAAALEARAAEAGLPQLAAMAVELRAEAASVRASGEDALALAQRAAHLAEASRNDQVLLDARLTQVRHFMKDGDLAHAREALDAARAASQRLGSDPARSPAVQGLDSYLLIREGAFEKAIASADAILEHTDAASGDHCAAFMYRASAETSLGRDAAVRADAEAAVRCYEALMGRENPTVADALLNEAAMLSRLGDEAGAEVRAGRALAILEKDPDRRAYALALYNHGLALKRKGEAARGIPELERAVTLAEQRGDRGLLARMVSGLAEALQDQGQLQRAEVTAARSVELSREIYGAQSLELATALSVQGGVREALGRHAEAAALLTEALRILEKTNERPVLTEVTRYDLARSQWHAPATRRQAVQAVRAVRDSFKRRGPSFDDYTREADEWLAHHRP